MEIITTISELEHMKVCSFILRTTVECSKSPPAAHFNRTLQLASIKYGPSLLGVFWHPSVWTNDLFGQDKLLELLSASRLPITGHFCSLPPSMLSHYEHQFV